MTFDLYSRPDSHTVETVAHELGLNWTDLQNAILSAAPEGSEMRDRWLLAKAATPIRTINREVR